VQGTGWPANPHRAERRLIRNSRSVSALIPYAACGGGNGPIIGRDWCHPRESELPFRTRDADIICPLDSHPLDLPYADLEQLTLNQRVQGSSPCAPTKVFNSYIGIFAALGHTGVTRLRNDGAAFNRRRLRRRAS